MMMMMMRVRLSKGETAGYSSLRKRENETKTTMTTSSQEVPEEKLIWRSGTC